MIAAANNIPPACLEYLADCKNIAYDVQQPSDYCFVLSTQPVECAIANLEICSETRVIVHAYRPVPTRRFQARPSPLAERWDCQRFPELAEYPELGVLSQFRASTGRWPVLHTFYDDEAQIDVGFGSKTRFLAYFTEFGRDFVQGDFEVTDDAADLIAVEMLRQLVG